jgi:excisionase family DNA binding protein
MEHSMDDLIPVPEASRRAGVARNTMHRAVKSGKIKGLKLGRDWFIYASDIERWKREVYLPNRAGRYPVKKDDENST